MVIFQMRSDILGVNLLYAYSHKIIRVTIKLRKSIVTRKLQSSSTLNNYLYLVYIERDKEEIV